MENTNHLDADEALEKMLELADNLRDKACNHIKADDLLCEVLLHHGYTELVDAYNSIDKWYA